MTENPAPDTLADELVSVCRTTIGDVLRSVVSFTADDYEQLYLRSDLEPDADLEAFVGNERLGFQSQHTYGESELGEYEFTIRVFEDGYLTRVVHGETGVFVTTDAMHVDEFEELATAVHHVIRGHDEAVTTE